nr:RNA polymerase sigma factor [candidate division Zixibacteria bacterium]
MDRQQFWKLLEPIHPAAEAFCRKLTGNRDDGDDLYQEGLLAAIVKIESLKDPNSFRPWLYRILVNRFKNRYRRSWWSRKIDRSANGSATSGIFDPRGEYDSRRWLERTMRVLSAEDRALILLYEIEGWKVAELASMFGKPEGTIKARLFRARRKMREVVENYLARTETVNSAGEAIHGKEKYAMPGSDSAD